jgi:hypothetical protein
MTTSSLRFPYGAATIENLFSADTLANTGRRSSRWQILDAFLRFTEATAMRVSEAASGLLIMTGIPGRPNTGAFYLYDEITRSFYSVYFADKDTFNASEFDYTVVFYDLQRLIDVPRLQLVHKTAAPADKQNVQDAVTPQRNHQNRNRSRNRSRRPRQASCAAIHLVSVPALQPVAVMG